MSAAPPVWLTAPTRFAALRRGQARWVIAALIALIAASFLALLVPDAPALSATSGGDRNMTDLAVYEKIAAAVKGGDNYYLAAADALRAGAYPLRPFLTFRLPGLATILAALPDWAPRWLLLALAIGTGIAWGFRLREALARPVPQAIAMLLILGSLLAFLQPGLVAFHEIWAGLLVALSLALRRPGRWIEAAAIGLVAMLIRETAALYVLIMALLAWREGAGREALGWAAALLLFAATLGMHAWAVTGVTGPLDPSSPGWAGLHGPGLFVTALTRATALQLLPLAAAAPILALALFGWASWNDPLGTRITLVFAAYALAISVFARLDTFYWGLMVAPVILAGLVFLPDALRDLARQSSERGRPRVTVTRVTR